jgi:hypothetical protein
MGKGCERKKWEIERKVLNKKSVKITVNYYQNYHYTYIYSVSKKSGNMAIK